MEVLNRKLLDQTEYFITFPTCMFLFCFQSAPLMTKNIRIAVCVLNLNIQLSKTTFLNIIIFLYFVGICSLSRLCIKYFPMCKVNQTNTIKVKKNSTKQKKPRIFFFFRRTLTSSIHYCSSVSPFTSNEKLNSKHFKIYL